MMRNHGLSLALLMTLAVSGCSLTATLIPVEGPLSQLRPVPVIQAKADGIMGNTGNISFTMPDGGTCNGRWSSAAGASVTVARPGSSRSTDRPCCPAIRFLPEPGRTLVKRSRFARRGASVQLEFVTGAGTGHGFGMARRRSCPPKPFLGPL